MSEHSLFSAAHLRSPTTDPELHWGKIEHWQLPLPFSGAETAKRTQSDDTSTAEEGIIWAELRQETRWLQIAKAPWHDSGFQLQFARPFLEN